MNTALRGIFYSASSLVALKVLGAAGSFIVAVIIVKNLGVNEAGQYFVIYSGALIGAVVARYGLDHYIIRNVACCLSEERGLNQLLSVVFHTLLLPLLLVFIASIFVTIYLYASEAKIELILTSIATLLFVLFHAWANIGASILQGQSHSLESGLAMSVGLPIINACSLLLLTTFFDINLVMAICTLMLSSSLVAIGSLIRVRALIFFIRPSFSEVKILLLEGRSFFTERFLQIGIGQAPILLVGFFLGAEASSIFGVSSRISSLWGFINTSVSRVIAPIYASLTLKESEAISMEKGLRRFGEIQLIAIAVFIFFTDDLLGLFGEVYKSGHYLLSLLLVNQAVLYFVTKKVMEHQMTGSEKYVAKVAILRLALTLGLSLPLMHLFGLEGMAICMLIESFFCWFLFSFKSVNTYA